MSPCRQSERPHPSLSTELVAGRLRRERHSCSCGTGTTFNLSLPLALTSRHSDKVKPRRGVNRYGGFFCKVGLGRVELPTSRLSGVRSNHLSYRPQFQESGPSNLATTTVRLKTGLAP